MRSTPLTLVTLVIAGWAFSASPTKATIVAFKDASLLPGKDRCFARYLAFPDEGEDRFKQQYVSTLFGANKLSTVGTFGRPVPVRDPEYPGVWLARLDVRDYGWDKRLEVWERFGNVDPFFHMKAKFITEPDPKAVYIKYWPGGLWDGKPYPKGPYPVQGKVGDQINIPALWADPSIVVEVDLVGKAKSIACHDELRKMLITESPILYGPWWLMQTSRQLSLRNTDDKTGPYDFLGIKNRQSIFDLTGANPETALKRFAEFRQVVEGGTSEIALHNRAVGVLPGETGWVWFTLDTDSEVGRGILKRNLRPGEYLHAAEEWLFHLFNGLQAGTLTNAKGELQKSAPDTVVKGNSSPLNKTGDPRVHNDLACVHCHLANKDGVREVKDWARETFRKNKNLIHFLQDPRKDVKIELESLYLRSVDLIVKQDRERYAQAVAELTAPVYPPNGISCAKLAEIYSDEINKYTKRVSLEVGAAEMGVTKNVLREMLFKYNADRGGGDLVLYNFTLDPSADVSRLEWESSIGYAHTIVRGLKIPEIAVKVKKEESDPPAVKKDP